jgi:hypothetical protein
MLFSRDKQRLEARRLEILQSLTTLGERYASLSQTLPGLEPARTDWFSAVDMTVADLMEEGLLEHDSIRAYHVMHAHCFEGADPIIAYDENRNRFRNREIRLTDIELAEEARKKAVDDLERLQYQGLLGTVFG